MYGGKRGIFDIILKNDGLAAFGDAIPHRAEWILAGIRDLRGRRTVSKVYR
jgi:hypothetical protein